MDKRPPDGGCTLRHSCVSGFCWVSGGSARRNAAHCEVAVDRRLAGLCASLAGARVTPGGLLTRHVRTRSVRRCTRRCTVRLSQ